MPLRIRKGQAPKPLDLAAFEKRYGERFVDPAFDAERDAIQRLAAIAFDAYKEGRKAPVTRKAGPRFADPSYELSSEWYATHKAINAAQARWKKKETPSRILIVNGSPRNDGTCPGEISKSWRLAESMRRVVQAAGMEADVLDLSLVTSNYSHHIHPCKGCVSSAMPLCHWPCSCYPNHADGQVGDWMAEIYERWVAAHGVIIVAPTHWYQSPTPLKAMIDRLVCADGGNPDPTTTHGKKVQEAPSRSSWMAGLDGPDRCRCHGATGSLRGLFRAVLQQPRHDGQGQGLSGRSAQRRARSHAGRGAHACRAACAARAQAQGTPPQMN